VLTLAAAHTFDSQNISIFMAGRFYGGTFFGLLSFAGGSAHLRNPGTPNRFDSVGRDLALQLRNNGMLLGVVCTGSDTLGYSNYEATDVGIHVTGADGTGATLGEYNGGAGGAFDVSEIAIYEGTPPAISDIKAYFNAKYHYPVSGFSKNVIFEGDSITAGSGQPEILSYPTQMLRTGNEDWRQLNVSTSGATVATLTGRAATTDTFQGTGRNVLWVLIGRNDVAADDGPTVYGNIKTYVTARVAAGWEVWVCTCIATGVSLQPTIDVLNGLIRGTPLGGSGPGIIADAGATKVIDFGAQPHFQTSTDAANASYYQGDSTHPNAAGAALLATYGASQLV
jgi:lysophospholipase L1-like esterase